MRKKARDEFKARSKGMKTGAIANGIAKGVVGGGLGFLVGGPAMGLLGALSGTTFGITTGIITGDSMARAASRIKEKKYEDARNELIDGYKKQMDDRNWKYSSEEIKMKMDIAKKDDCYDVGFLRFASPDDSNKSQTLELYSSYLKDPAAYDKLFDMMPGMLEVAADASYKNKQTEKKRSYNVDFEEVFDAGGERYLDLENGKMTKDQYNKIKDKEYKKYMKDPSNYADRGYKKGG